MNGAASSVREITEESSSEEATSHEVTFERGAIIRVQYLMRSYLMM